MHWCFLSISFVGFVKKARERERTKRRQSEMELAHQYYEVDVPRHAKTSELVTIVIFGDVNCAIDDFAMTIASPADLMISYGDSSSSPFRPQHDPKSVVSGLFSPRQWVPRRGPSLVFHPLVPFHIVAAQHGKARIDRQQAEINVASSPSPKAMRYAGGNASLSVLSHTLGVGCGGGSRSDTMGLIPGLLIPHAVVTWHAAFDEAMYSPGGRSMDELCRLVMAADLVDAQLSAPHQPHWQKTRRLVIVLHKVLPVVPPAAEDNSGHYASLLSSTLTAEKFLETCVPNDRRVLLQAAFCSIELVFLPHASQSHSSGSPHHANNHDESSSSPSKRDGPREVGEACTIRKKQIIRKIVDIASTLSCSHDEGVNVAVMNASILSRYFAECSVRMATHGTGGSGAHGMQATAGSIGLRIADLPIFSPVNEFTQTSLVTEVQAGRHPAAVVLRRIRSEFVLQDALSSLRTALMSRLTSNEQWTSILQRLDAPAVVAKVEENTEPGSAGAPVASAASAREELERLCNDEMHAIRQQYFTGGGPAQGDAVRKYLDQSSEMIASILADAKRKARETKRAELRDKLSGRLEMLVPLLQKILVGGRFTSFESHEL